VSNPLTPSEQELKAAEESVRLWCCGKWYQATDWERIAAVIATHTRHEGKTAQELALQLLGEAQSYKELEHRVLELEAILGDCNYRGVPPPLSSKHRLNALHTYQRRVQVEVLERMYQLMDADDYYARDIIATEIAKLNKPKE
jgi:hypothetical protein